MLSLTFSFATLCPQLSACIGLCTIPYYWYGHKLYGPKRVRFTHTCTIQIFLKGWTVWYGYFYGHNTVYS